MMRHLTYVVRLAGIVLLVALASLVLGLLTETFVSGEHRWADYQYVRPAP